MTTLQSSSDSGNAGGSGIVADGASRALSSPEFFRRREELEDEVWDEYYDRFREAGFAGGVLLLMKIHRDIRRRTRKLEAEFAPTRAFW